MNETNTPDVSQAVATLVHALFPKISFNDAVGIFSAIFLIARTLRKIAPDAMQNGQLGLILKHLALEINPPSPIQPPPLQSPDNAQARHDAELAKLNPPKVN